MADYPSAIYSGGSVTDGTDYPQAAHINTLRREIEAIETQLGINFSGLTATNTATVTNKRIQRRAVTVTQAAEPTINTDNGDIFNITALAQAITSLTTNLSGTPVVGEFININFTDNGTGRAITPGASFVGTLNNSLTGLTTVANKTLYTLWRWNGTAWALFGRDQNL